MQLKLQQKLFILFILSLIPLSLFAESNFIDSSLKINRYSEFTQQVDSLKLENKKSVEKDSVAADSTVQKPFIQTAIEYDADGTVLLSNTDRKVFLTNKAFVKYGSTELRAYYIELDLEKKEAFAYGIQDSTGTLIQTPEFKDGSEEFTCKELKYNFETGKGLVNEVITEQESGYVHSEITKRMDETTFFLKNGKYTTCGHDHPHFYVRMTKAKMIKDDKIISGPLHIVLEDVPLPIGLPFGFFPFSSKYSSGILLPSYGEEQRRGFNLRGGGYYWAINDYVDLAIRADIFANGSWGTNIQSKYKKRYKFNGNLSGEYHKNKYGDKGLADYSKVTDFAVRWTHTQDPKANPYRTFSASVNFSTSQNDRNNSQNINKIVNNQKQSSISYSKKWPGKPFSLNGSLRHSQNSRDTTIALTLPSLSFNMTQIYPFRSKGKSSGLKWYDKIGVSYTSKMENRVNIKEKKLLSSSLTKDWKNGYQHSIPISTNFKLAKDLTLSPTLNYQGVLYSRSIRKSWDKTMNKDKGGVAIDTVQGFRYAHNYSTSASLSLSPKIYGMYTFSKKSKIEAIRHVMTPSISVSYTPEIGVARSKYYNTYKNGSGDDIEYSIFEGSLYGTPTGAMESGSVSLSLDNNIEAKIKTANDTTGDQDFKKVKLLESLRFSTSYNMFADSLNWSALRINGRTKIFDNKLGINVNSTIDPYGLNQNNVRVDRFDPRLVNASIRLDFRLSSTDFKAEEEEGNKDDESKSEDMTYIDFDIPWSFAIDYGWTYTKPQRKGNVVQTLRLNGNFSLTPKWKLNFSSGYDFANKAITTTQLSITRDLHCWQMSFNTVPFGPFQNYNFKINVKSSVLQDLKYEKKKVWQDN